MVCLVCCLLWFVIVLQAQQVGVMLSNEARILRCCDVVKEGLEGLGCWDVESSESSAAVDASLQALTSLAQLPPEHSVELLEFVLDRAQEYWPGTTVKGQLAFREVFLIETLDIVPFQEISRRQISTNIKYYQVFELPPPFWNPTVMENAAPILASDRICAMSRITSSVIPSETTFFSRCWCVDVGSIQVVGVDQRSKISSEAPLLVASNRRKARWKIWKQRWLRIIRIIMQTNQTSGCFLNSFEDTLWDLSKAESLSIVISLS